MDQLISLTILSTAAALLLGCSHAAPPVAARVATPVAAHSTSVAGSWRMHLTVGTHHFEDQLTLETTPTGLGGRLEVPGKFTATLERVRLEGRSLTFDILADEGPTPYRVHYEGRLDARGLTYTGRASLPETHETLGAFVAEKETTR